MKTKGRKSLRYEITAAITLKLVLLFGLWALCFSHPVKSHITNESMRAHFLSSTPNPVTHKANP